MNFGRTPVIGRNIIDIDGCLKATDLPSLSAREVAGLIGTSVSEVQVFVERYDELVPLTSNERVTLTQETVHFFRTLPIVRHGNIALSTATQRQPLARAA